MVSALWAWVAAASILLGVGGPAFPHPADPEGAGFEECRAFAPPDVACGITIVPEDGVRLEIPIATAFSGTLVLKAEQFGTVVWNGSCVIPLGFIDTGVGGCLGEDEQRFVAGALLNISARVGVYGVGSFGVRAYY